MAGLLLTQTPSRGRDNFSACRKGVVVHRHKRSISKRGSMNWHRFIGITLLLYGLINPVGAVPIYLHLIRKMSAAKAQRILYIASLTVACLLVVAALFGTQILKFFSVGLDDFRIAGGILALVIAFEMFKGVTKLPFRFARHVPRWAAFADSLLEILTATSKSRTGLSSGDRT